MGRRPCVPSAQESMKDTVSSGRKCPQKQRPKGLLEKNKHMLPGAVFCPLNYWSLWFDLLEVLAGICKSMRTSAAPACWTLLCTVLCLVMHAPRSSCTSNCIFHAKLCCHVAFSFHPWSTYVWDVTDRWVFLWFPSNEAWRQVWRTWMLLSFSKINQLSTGNCKHVPGSP